MDSGSRVGSGPERKGNGESALTVKWFGVLTLLCVVLGFFFISITSLDRRVTTVEVQFTSLKDTLTKVELLSREIRDTQLRNVEQRNK